MRFSQQRFRSEARTMASACGRALQPQLIPYQKKTAGWRGGAQWRAAALAVGCAVLLAAQVPRRPLLGADCGEQTQPSLVIRKRRSAWSLVVLTDHLDRTERLLVELEHANCGAEPRTLQLQSEARELLASNRLYRATASNAGDPALAGALDRLEGVLAEVANDPNLTAADLERVRKDMNTEGILFEIRVLLARSPDQGSGPRPAKGASI